MLLNATAACLLILGLMSESVTSQTAIASDTKSKLELNEPNFDTRKIRFLFLYK